ncbi:hypothetical protein CRM90_24410 [Mycobacterium sp. ENV421]|nr:hypothetical protein CRM90_24410 [Mycobacterium sp. ENV421]
MRVDRTAADEVTEYLERAATTPAAQVAPHAEPASGRAETPVRRSDDEPGLPTRSHAYPRPNPQFHRTQYANRV